MWFSYFYWLSQYIDGFQFFVGFRKFYMDFKVCPASQVVCGFHISSWLAASLLQVFIYSVASHFASWFSISIWLPHFSCGFQDTFGFAFPYWFPKVFLART
jgi:hypothetical protein